MFESMPRLICQLTCRCRSGGEQCVSQNGYEKQVQRSIPNICVAVIEQAGKLNQVP